MSLSSGLRELVASIAVVILASVVSVSVGVGIAAFLVKPSPL